MLIKSTVENFQLSSEGEAEKLIDAVKELIKCSLYDPAVSMNDFCAANLEWLDARVAKLVLSILNNCSAEWAECR